MHLHFTQFALAALAGAGLLLNSEAAIPTSYPTGSGPASVSYGSDGKLVYVYESNGDRIPDFSGAGYRGSDDPIPDNIPVRRTVTPVAGDNLSNIQSAITAVEAMSLDASGFRGVVLLKAGVYPMTGTLQIRKSGIVIRGEGSGTNGTVLQRTDVAGDDLILAEPDPKTGRSEVSGTRHNIVNNYVPVGATWVTLDSVSNLAVGDPIVIRRPQTTAWVDAMGMGTSGTGDWQSGDATCNWDRIITEIDGNRIRFDAPITQAIEAQWTTNAGSQPYVYKYSWPGRIENIGIEDIRGESIADLDAYGNYIGDLFTFNQLQNGWIRRCYNNKMRGHSIKLNSSKWVTVQDVISYHPTRPSHSGPATQIFTGDSMDLCLFHRVLAYSAGFEFSAGKSCPGPVVYSECQVPEGFAASGPHMQWNNGFLWDALRMEHSLSVQLQGRGWNGANHLAWNVATLGSINFERPPTVHLWIQGSMSPDSAPPPPRSSTLQYGARSPETLSWGTPLEPGSLYRAQLQERIGLTEAKTLLGDPDGNNYFWLTNTTTERTVTAGSAASYNLDLAVSADYNNESIGFTASNLPTGTSVAFSPTVRTSPGAIVATLSTSTATPAGTYYIRIRGSGSFSRYVSSGNQTLTRSTFLKLNVNGAPPPQTQTYEAEQLTISATSGDTTSINSESGASNGQYVMVNSNAANDFVSFTLPNVSPGNYLVTVGYKRYTSRGIVQTLVGPAGGSIGNLGSPLDMYGSSAFVAANIGNWTIGTTGNKTVQLKITGKNPSSSGYTMAIDYIQLTPQ